MRTLNFSCVSAEVTLFPGKIFKLSYNSRMIKSGDITTDVLSFVWFSGNFLNFLAFFVCHKTVLRFLCCIMRFFVLDQIMRYLFGLHYAFLCTFCSTELLESVVFHKW